MVPRIFSIPQDLYGERIKPFSIDLEVTTQGDTYTIKDDGEGNLYDNETLIKFLPYKSSSFDYDKAIQGNGSGSQVGNVFYDDGILVLTDTGSLKQAVNEDGTIYGHTLKYKTTHTIYEYEYLVTTIEPNEYNISINQSLTKELSGSLTIERFKRYTLVLSPIRPTKWCWYR